MGKLQKLLTEKIARKLSSVMTVVCYLIIVLLAVTLVLSCMGRLQYSLDTVDGSYPNAIYAEESHDFSTRSFTISSNDDLYIRTNSADGKIELATYIAVVAMYASGIIPIMFAYFFLAKVFSNIQVGEIFIRKNAQYLLYFATIQIAVAVLLPFIKLLIAKIADLLVADYISLSTGSDMLNNLIPNIAFLVAAYIINYGVNLQDEVDATL